MLALSKIKAFTDEKINVTQKFKFGLVGIEKQFKKRRKCSFPAFSSFPKMFVKASLLMVLESRHCVQPSLSQSWPVSFRHSDSDMTSKANREVK